MLARRPLSSASMPCRVIFFGTLMMITASVGRGGECSGAESLPLPMFLRMGLRGGGETRGDRGGLGCFMVDTVRKSMMAKESNDARWERLQREAEELKVKAEAGREVWESKRQRKREEREGDSHGGPANATTSRAKRPKKSEAQTAPNISALLDSRNISHAGADEAFEEGSRAAQDGRLEDAAIAYVFAHRMQPDNASIGFAAGCAMHEVGDSRGAFKLYHEMLSRGITTAELLCGYANLMRECANVAIQGEQVMSVNGSVVGFAFSPASNESSKDRRGRDTEKVLSLVQEIYEEALNLSSYKDLAIVSDYATFLGEWMADFDGEYAAYRAAAAADPGSFEAQIAMGAKAVARSSVVAHELSILSDYNQTFTEHRKTALPGHFVGESGKTIPIVGHEELVEAASSVIENATVLIEERQARLSHLAIEGATALQKASELDPQSGAPLALHAALLANALDDELGAEKLLQKAISVDQNCAQAHHLYAQIMDGRGEAEASLLLLKKAARLAPGSAMVLCDLAVALKARGKREEGLRVMDRARGIVDAASGQPGTWELEQEVAREVVKY